MKVFIIFPHQLFEDTSLLRNVDEVILIEEYLFFKQYKFHKQKIILHRASMRYYENYLVQKGIKVRYIEAIKEDSDIRVFLKNLTRNDELHYYDPCDYWLEQRIYSASAKLKKYTSPYWINSEEDVLEYFGKKEKYFQTDFYIQQRKKLNILLTSDGKPEGGKWSFDADNRLKYPKDKIPPKVTFPQVNEYYTEAIEYVHTYFKDHYGEASHTFIYPTTHATSLEWLRNFLKERFDEFGPYEDAMVDTETILHHSVLTPMLNIGLLTPLQVIEETLHYAKQHSIEINNIEGFIRQIIGWREFIRGVYVVKGREQRTRNYWKYEKSLPLSFYDGTTGIQPVDDVIHKVLRTGYCHHIERLMILGNIMLLKEYHPDSVYRWFMELFIDAYDWVMVPNVYGMSQFADGGVLATKPYISGSSYVLKMSNYKKSDWCAEWDALFWHFMNKHRDFFLSNPRLGMLIKTYDKMSPEKKKEIKRIADKSLS